MMGTLARGLAEKDISTAAEYYRAEVEGDIENVNNLLKITRIRVRYQLNLPRGKDGAAREVLSTYLERCPAAQSVIGCIEIRDEAVIEEIRL